MAGNLRLIRVLHFEVMEMAFANFLQSVEDNDVWSLAVPSTKAFSVNAKSLRKSAVLGRSCTRKKTLSLSVLAGRACYKVCPLCLEQFLKVIGILLLSCVPQPDTLPPLNLATLYYTVPDVDA